MESVTPRRLVSLHVTLRAVWKELKTSCDLRKGTLPPRDDSGSLLFRESPFTNTARTTGGSSGDTIGCLARAMTNLSKVEIAPSRNRFFRSIFHVRVSSRSHSRWTCSPYARDVFCTYAKWPCSQNGQTISSADWCILIK